MKEYRATKDDYRVALALERELETRNHHSGEKRPMPQEAKWTMVERDRSRTRARVNTANEPKAKRSLSYEGSERNTNSENSEVSGDEDEIMADVRTAAPDLIHHTLHAGYCNEACPDLVKQGRHPQVLAFPPKATITVVVADKGAVKEPSVVKVAAVIQPTIVPDGSPVHVANPAATKPRVPNIPHPPKFSGDSKEDVEDALTQFEVYLTKSGVPTADWTMHAPNLLAGNALKAWTEAAKPERLIKGDEPSWEFLKSTLMTAYENPNREQDKWMALRKIQQLGDVPSYLRAFTSAVAAVEETPGPKDQLFLFWNGLKPAVQSLCAVDNTTGKAWTSLDALSEYAATITNILGRTHHPRVNAISEFKGKSAKGQGRGPRTQGGGHGGRGSGFNQSSERGQTSNRGRGGAQQRGRGGRFGGQDRSAYPPRPPGQEAGPSNAGAPVARQESRPPYQGRPAYQRPPYHNPAGAPPNGVKPNGGGGGRQGPNKGK